MPSCSLEQAWGPSGGPGLFFPPWVALLAYSLQLLVTRLIPLSHWWVQKPLEMAGALRTLALPLSPDGGHPASVRILPPQGSHHPPASPPLGAGFFFLRLS